MIAFLDLGRRWSSWVFGYMCFTFFPVWSSFSNLMPFGKLAQNSAAETSNRWFAQDPSVWTGLSSAVLLLLLLGVIRVAAGRLHSHSWCFCWNGGFSWQLAQPLSLRAWSLQQGSHPSFHGVRLRLHLSEQLIRVRSPQATWLYPRLLCILRSACLLFWS